MNPAPSNSERLLSWSVQWNFAAYVDKLLQPNVKGGDPEGILSTMPAMPSFRVWREP